MALSALLSSVVGQLSASRMTSRDAYLTCLVRCEHAVGHGPQTTVSLFALKSPRFQSPEGRPALAGEYNYVVDTP